MAGKKIGADLVEQALKLIAGGVKEAGPSAAERAAQNLDVFNTAKRLGEDTNDIAKLQETKRLMDFHKNLMGDVNERAKSLAELQQQMRDQGAFPMEIGTRFTTGQSRRTGQSPWTVTHYYVNPKNPQADYGYYIRRESPNGGYEETISKIRDPKLEAIHGPEKWEEFQKGIIPMTGPKVVKNSGGRTGYGPGGVIDDIVKMAGKIVSGADEPAKTGIRAYQGSPHDFAAERLVRFPDKTEQYIVGTPDVLPDVPEGAEVVQDFPLGRMRMDKIGTGEGAQAYGHGLYAAEAEPTARGYRDALTDRASSFRVENIDMPKWILRGIESSPDRAAAIAKYREDFSNRLLEAQKEAEGSVQPWLAAGRISSAKDVLAGLDALERGASMPHTAGRMYEVNINADPNAFLDWDKPLSEQPELYEKLKSSGKFNVNDAVVPGTEKRIISFAGQLGINDLVPLRVQAGLRRGLSLEQALLEAKGSSDNPSWSSQVDKLADALSLTGVELRSHIPSHWTGESLLQGNVNNLSKKQVSELLAKEGIPGIKFLDAGSRGAATTTQSHIDYLKNQLAINEQSTLKAQSNRYTPKDYIKQLEAERNNLTAQIDKLSKETSPTHNYVVFDDRLISIIRKYGIAGASAMLGYNLMDGLDSKQSLAATMADQDYQNASGQGEPRVAKGGGGAALDALEKALLVAREGIEGLAKSKGKTPQELLGGFANQKPRVPFEEWRYEFEPTADLLQSKEFSPESLRPGDVIIPLIGDRTSTGRKITSIAGQPLETPAITEGGPDYMRGPSQQADKSVWASGKGVISQLEGRIQNALRASETKGYKDPSVYGSYVAMGPQSGDFSTHTAEAVMGMLPGSKIKRADVKEFDAKMRERFADWPGIKSPKAADYVINANAGEHRKAFLDVMDSAYWRDKGFPDVSLARYATTTPELVSAPTEAAGYNIARITPFQKPELITQIHRSYPSTMHGEYVGGLPAGMTRDELFTQFSRGFDADPPARNYVMAKRRSFGMDPNAFQVMDEPEIQALIDKVERIKRGYEQGGEVYEDDDINDALRIAKDNGGSTGSVFMTDAKGINYDINGNIIPPEVTGPNPARSEATPEQVGQRAAQDPATFDALMQKYAVPDQDIARYEATKAAVANQPYETQQMTHVGAPPMRDVKVDMPLLGGVKKITQAPYNVAGPMSMAAQTAYDLKTVPLYFTPFTAPIGAGLDIGEGVATGDPLQASLAALGAPGKYAKAAIIGGSNYLMSPAEAQAGPARWFSKAMEVANAIPMNKMTGEQALAMLRKGTSPEELKWTGTDVFLQGKPQVTKQELVDYLNKNRVQTQDVVLGGSKPFRRDDVVPSETAIASMKQRWDELAAKKREINQQVMLAPSERRANSDQLMEEQIAIDDEMDKLHGKMIDDTIAEMGGLGRSPKYTDYSTPGGEGYQETLVTLGNKGMPRVVQQGNSWTLRDADNNPVLNSQGAPYWYYDKPDAERASRALYRESGKYKSSHWDDPDVLLHTRSQVLDVTPTGANRPYKAWNVDETQSDWGQDARKKGVFDAKAHAEWDAAYRENSKKISEVQNQLKTLNTERSAALGPEPKSYGTEFNEYHTRRQSLLDNDPDIAVKRKELADLLAEGARLDASEPKRGQGSVAAAPYIGSTEGWTDLAIKKQLDMALDNGSDYFTWTPGDVQAERYRLDKQISGLKYDPLTKVLYYLPKDYVDDGFDWETFGSGIEPEKLEDYVGKEVAEKLLASPGDKSDVKSLSGLDLKVGGEGMRGYYDKVYLKRLQEVVKKATGEKPNIEVIEVQTAKGPRKQLGIRLTDEMREKARFSDFNKGGRVTGGNTYDNDSSVAHALALTSEY